MPDIKIGISLASLRQPLKYGILTAKKLGADAVEIDARADLKPAELTRTAARQFLKTLDDMGLRVAAVRFLTRRGYDVQDELDRRIQATRAAMRMAHDLGATVVVGRVPVPSQEDEPDRWNLLLDVLADLGEYSQRVGVFLAARTGDDDGSRLAELIEALPLGSLAVDLDPAELIAGGYAADAATKKLARHVVYVHATDAVRDFATRSAIEVQLGRGSADWPSLVGELAEHDYRGYFTIRRDRCDDPEVEIGQSVKYLRSL